MKRLLHIVLVLSVAVPWMVSCHTAEPLTPEDPEPEYVEPRIVDPQQKNSEVNSTLRTIKYVLDWKKNNEMATKLQPIVEDGREVGYKIRFRKVGSMNVYKDILCPDYKYLPLGLKKEGDTCWWTVNGERYHDYFGNIYSANESLLVFEESFGGVRFGYDKSGTMKLYCKDDVYLNVSLLKDVSHKDGLLTLILADSLELSCPWQEECDLYFPDKTDLTCVPGCNAMLSYKLEGFPDDASVTVSSPKGWSAETAKSGNPDVSGSIIVHSPSDAVFPAEFVVTAKSGDKSVSRSFFVSEGSVSIDAESYSAPAKAGLLSVYVTSNTPYGISLDENSKEWLQCKQQYGTGEIIFTFAENPLKSIRRAVVSILDATSCPILSFSLEQAGVEAYYKKVTVSEFLEGGAPDIDYFIIKGIPSGISAGGALTLSDGSGSVYVPSLSNYEKYAHRFSPSAKLVLQGRRGLYEGKVALTDASIKYFIDNRVKAAAPWLELPAEDSVNGLEFFHHPMTIDGVRTRNYSFYWDYDALIAPMVAYPLNDWLRGRGGRSDMWGIDPLLPRDKQPVLLRTYGSSYCGFNVDRGHQCPSADRYHYAANVDTFYGTNMTPQMSTFNQSFWVGLENKVRYWSTRCDTLYVVTGCLTADSPGYVLDNDGKKVTVPGHYFKVALAYKNDPSFGHNGYQACAVFLDHRMYKEVMLEPRMSTSVDELEALTGYDFFANLPGVVGDDVAEAVEEENPADVEWWWIYE